MQILKKQQCKLNSIDDYGGRWRHRATDEDKKKHSEALCKPLLRLWLKQTGKKTYNLILIIC